MEKVTGALIMLFSTAIYAAIFPLLKKTNQQVPPFMTMAVSMFVLFMLSLASSLFFEGNSAFRHIFLKSNLSFLILAGVLNFVAFWLGILGFKYFAIWQQNMFYLLSPVFASIAAWIILGENINSNFIIGLVVMSIGLVIAIR